MSEHEAAVTPRKHSLFGGSSASRWINCAGSTALVVTVPKGPDSAYSKDGTNAHSLGEHCLKNGERSALEHVGATFTDDDRGLYNGTNWIVTEEMAQAVQVYLDTVYAELDASPDAQLYVEQAFEIKVASADEGEVFGSNDAMVYTPSKGRLVVYDYKHGAGVSVSAEDNAQLKFYAAGACLSHPDWPISEVILCVVQPRSRDAEENDGGVKPWTMEPLDLIEFAGEIEMAIAEAKAQMEAYARVPLAGTLSLKLGSWCRWCPAAPVCPAKEGQALQSMGFDLHDITAITLADLPKAPDMDTARLARVAAAVAVLTAWGEQIRAYMEGLIVQGVPVPGWKLVEKIGRRSWIDSEEEIAAYLEVVHGLPQELIRPPKLVTITEAERQLKAAVTDKAARKEALDELSLKYTIKDSSGVTIAPESDKRPAVNAAARDFGPISTIDLQA